MSSQETPRLSPSIAHKLLSESPLSAWAAHRLLGNMREPSSTSQAEGRLWHAAILGGGDDIVVIDVADFRTKDAREARDSVLRDGKIPIAAPRFQEVMPAADAIRCRLEQEGIAWDGTVEKKFHWTEYTEGGEAVECSGIVDHFNAVRIDDLKTGKTATSLHMAVNLIARSTAILQDSAYRSAVCSESEAEPEDMDMVFSFVQTQPPFSVTPVRMSGTFREVSHLRWRRAIELWHSCLSKGTEREHWPDVTTGISVVDAPGWMLAQEIEFEALR